MHKTLCIDDDTKFKGVRYGNIVAATNDVADYVNIRMYMLKGEVIIGQSGVFFSEMQIKFNQEDFTMTWAIDD